MFNPQQIFLLFIRANKARADANAASCQRDVIGDNFPMTTRGLYQTAEYLGFRDGLLRLPFRKSADPNEPVQIGAIVNEVLAAMEMNTGQQVTARSGIKAANPAYSVRTSYTYQYMLGRAVRGLIR